MAVLIIPKINIPILLPNKLLNILFSSNKGLFLYKLSILLNPPNIKEIQRENIKIPTILIVAITANLNFVLFNSLL